MSGFLGSILGQVEGALGGASPQAAGGLVGSLLQSVGGINGLCQRAQAAGLGEHVGSWIGSGSNLPISAEQVTQLFPPEQIEAFAEQHGVPKGIAAGLLAQLLPHAVHQATPGGAVPPAGQSTPADSSGSADDDQAK